MGWECEEKMKQMQINYDIWVFPRIGGNPPKWMVYNGKPTPIWKHLYNDIIKIHSRLGDLRELIRLNVAITPRFSENISLSNVRYVICT